jgi:hypothetical protein
VSTLDSNTICQCQDVEQRDFDGSCSDRCPESYDLPRVVIKKLKKIDSRERTVLNIFTLLLKVQISF